MSIINIYDMEGNIIRLKCVTCGFPIRIIGDYVQLFKFLDSLFQMFCKIVLFNPRTL